MKDYYQNNELNIDDAIKQFFKSQKLEIPIQQQSVINHWAEIVGEVIAEHTTNMFFKDGKLHVKISESCWRTELSYMRTKIKDKVNEHVGKNMIDEVVVY